MASSSLLSTASLLTPRVPFLSCASCTSSSGRSRARIAHGGRAYRLLLHCKNPILAKIDRFGKDKGAHFGLRPKTDKPSRRRRFALRLRPRLRLLSRSLRRLSPLGGVPALRRLLRRAPPAALVPVVLAALFFLLRLALPRSAAREVAYSELVSGLSAGAVASVVFEEASRRIYFSKVGDGGATDVGEGNAGEQTESTAAPKWRYYARKVDHDEGFLLGLMREHGVAYRSAPQSASKVLMSLLSTLLTLWISLVPMMWFIQRQLSASNGAARKRRRKQQDVSFDDVEGVEEAKCELMEIVSCLQGSLNYKKLGAKLPRGVLLVGPPGTGKTLLARAVAGEAGIPFFSVSASEFVEVFVGRGAARVRDLFNEAKESAPSIIFIDELDAVGGRRGRSFNDERDQTLNQLLTEMDGFDSDIKVIVMAATNRPEALDAALCRPGRFSRKVFVGVPDLEGRRKILAVHLREIPLEEDPEMICNLVATLTPGLVGADLANIVNEAALLAARRGGRAVTRGDVMDAIEREKYGINGSQEHPDSIKKGLAKLFPWLPTPGSNRPKPDGLEGLMGYHTLS